MITNLIPMQSLQWKENELCIDGCHEQSLWKKMS